MSNALFNAIQALAVGLVLFTIGSVPLSSHSADLPFTAAELVELEKGEIIIKHEEKEISESELSSLLVSVFFVPHPVEVIWEVLDHPEREVEWIPGVKQSKLVRDVCLSRTSRQNTTDYRLGGLGLEVYYSTIREYDYKNQTIKGYMDKERPARLFRDIESGWELFPYKNGTIFKYWSISRLDVDIPMFISDFLAERTLVAGAKSVRERCQEVAEQMKGGKTGSHPCSDFEQPVAVDEP